MFRCTTRPGAGASARACVSREGEDHRAEKSLPNEPNSRPNRRLGRRLDHAMPRRTTAEARRRNEPIKASADRQKTLVTMRKRGFYARRTMRRRRNEAIRLRSWQAVGGRGGFLDVLPQRARPAALSRVLSDYKIRPTPGASGGRSMEEFARVLFRAFVWVRATP
jgi:hypothetical protein